MNTRKHDLTLPIKTTPDELWKALTEEREIERWFAPNVRVVPGEGGSMWGSWGEGMEGESKIVKWDPGRLLSVSFGPQTVDYIIESNGTETVLRLVHSGFGADASFDGEYESTRGGWTTFLNILKHGLERHAGTPARNVSFFRKTGVPVSEAWRRIAQTGELSKGRAVPGHPEGYGGFIMPEWNDAYLAVFCEGRTNAMVTITWILYDLPFERIEALRTKWAELFDSLFPQAAPVTTSS